jgi:amidophosphoribosyltransferase
VKEHFEFGGEVLMGHLRYGTSGNFNESSCHPYFRRSNWATRNLMVLGNFNMTNAWELNQKLIERGQHPIFDTDTQTVLEEIGYHLDEQHQALYHRYRDAGMPGDQIPQVISQELDFVDILRRSAEVWDGGLHDRRPPGQRRLLRPARPQRHPPLLLVRGRRSGRLRLRARAADDGV